MHVVLQIILLGLFIFAALAYGAVHYWAYSVVYGVTFALCAVVLLQMGFSCLRKRTVHTEEGGVKKQNPPPPPFEKGGKILGPPEKLGKMNKEEEEINKEEEGVCKNWGKAYAWFLALFLLFVLFQLTPLPEGVLKTLSPYAAYLYGQAQTLTAPEAESAGRLPGYLTLDRDKTVKSLLALAAYFGFGFLVLRVVRRPSDLTRITLVLTAFSVGLALYGLLHPTVALPRTPGVKNSLIAGARVSATLINPDHFAGYLVMAVYLAFGYLTAFLRKPPAVIGRNVVQRGMSLLNAEGAYVPKALLLLFAIAVMTFVMFYTLSRGAVIGFAVSILLCFLLLFFKSRRPLFLLFMIPPAVFIAYYIRVVGADPLLQRLQETAKDVLQADDNARVYFYLAALDLWGKFSLCGAGLGSFEVIAPLMVLKYYQGSFIPYIHNDWLQLAVETGWAGGIFFVTGAGTLVVSVFLRWWRTENRWGFGFGLGALGAMTAMAIHAFLDFGLRVPINALFLVLLASLGLAALDEGFERRRKSRRKQIQTTPPGLSKRTTGARRWRAGLGLLVAGVACGWSCLLIGRYGLAQEYCPSEIDTVHRREHGVSVSKLQKALRLNPLNGDYWLNIALLAGLSEAADDDTAASGQPGVNDRARDAERKPINPPLPPSAKSRDSGLASSKGKETDTGESVSLDIVPRRVPGWEKARAGNASLPLQAWAYGQAILRSPAAGEFWLAYADYLREECRVAAEGTDATPQKVCLPTLLKRTAKAYALAVELQPNIPAVRERAADFAGWLKQKNLPDS